MQEVEVKFLDIDVEKLSQLLLSLGAQKVFDDDMRTCYFEIGENELKKQSKILRIRQEGSKCVLCSKTKDKTADAISSDEQEVTVADYDKTKAILLSSGFHIDKEFSKHRVSYKLEKFSFEFDTLDSIPTFLEIEAQSKEELDKAIELLKLNHADAKPWVASQIRDYYQNKN